MVAAVASLEMGAFSVALETVLSGRSELPLGRFAAVMLGIHLPIGLVEGLVTVAVVNFVRGIRPELIEPGKIEPVRSLRPVLIAFLVLAIVTSGGLAWFASSHPDGLEWTVARITGQEELAQAEAGIQGRLAGLQSETALLPDYDFPRKQEPSPAAGEGQASWPSVSAGTSFSGIVGSAVVLTLAGLIGLAAVKLRGTRSRE
jgi:cobalt/nickel transport system permease protein